jgi:cyclohexa-1,5-dienecarbonyl-CoA hydratase
MDAPLHVVRDGPVVRLSLARPPMNILDRALNRALATALREHAAESSVAVIVLDGGTSRGFSSGVEVADHTPERVGGMLEDFHAAVRALWDAECPTFAAVHGFALGGGLELALSCDLVVAESDARLGFPEISLGCYPPVAAAMLPRRIGWARASELVLTGETLTPERAATMGLVNRVCQPGGLGSETLRLVGSLTSKSPAVLREAKRALREGAASDHEALARIERRYLGSLMNLEDAAEGILAFMEKREPRFVNR